MKPLVFVLIGEPVLCEEKRKEIITSLQKEFGLNLAVTLKHAGDFLLTHLISEARTLPFLASAQVFCLPNADRFTKNDLELWNLYFQSPNPQTQFIFEAESLEKNHPILEWGRQKGQVFSLQMQREKMVGNLVRKKIKQAKKEITSEALQLLESRLGDSFAFIDTLLEQLILRSGQKLSIERSDVEALEEKFTRFEGFDLVQALAQKNLPKALEILNDLLEFSQDVPSLVGLLHWQFRRFWEAKKWLAQGISEREISSRLRLFSGRDSLFFKHLQRFSQEKLEKILEALFELDWRLKTGRAEGRYEMETWLVSAVG